MLAGCCHNLCLRVKTALKISHEIAFNYISVGISFELLLI
jgi:hypothetical protein